MLTVPPTLDDGSSMESTTTDRQHQQQQQPRDEYSLMNENDDWGVVTESHEGVLILEGEEAEAGGAAAVPALLTDGEHHHHDNNDNLQLSYPGTDSLPTVVGSIEALPPPPPTETKSSPEDTSNTKEDDSALHDAADNDDDHAAPTSGFDEKATSTNINTSTTMTENVSNNTGLPHSKLVLFLLAFSTLVACLTTIGLISYRNENQLLKGSAKTMQNRILYLTNDINDLKIENNRLSNLKFEVEQLLSKQEIRNRIIQAERDSVQMEKERLDLQVKELQTENEQMKQKQQREEETERQRQRDRILWGDDDADDCHAGGRGGRDTVLVDNCWLSAKANVQLGDCAKEAKDSVKDFSTKLLEQFHETSGAFASAHQETSQTTSSMVNDVEETVTKIFHKVDSMGKDFANNLDTLGKTLWKGMESTRTTSSDKDEEESSSSARSAERNRHQIKDFFSRMDDTGKSWFKDSLLGLFAEEEGEGVGGSDDNDENNNSEPKSDAALDKLVKELSVMMTAGESFVDKVLERAAEATDMSHEELLKTAKQAFEEADLSQHYNNNNNNNKAQ